MTWASRPRTDRNASLLLIGGFGLVILLLLLSGYLGIQAMEDAELTTSSLLQQQQAGDRLIDDLQALEARLSSLFYEVVSARESDRGTLLRDLNIIETAVDDMRSSARARFGGDRWDAVNGAITAYTGEMRRVLQQPARPVQVTNDLIERHELLVSALARLVRSNDDEMLLAYQRDVEQSQELLRRAFLVLGVALVLAVASAAGTVFAATRILRRTNWQAQELSRLSNHVLETQETVIRRFSRELHDELGQTLTAIEATLLAFPSPSSEQRGQLEDCQLLIKDAISKSREMSQLLRPSVLDDFGLCPSLQGLADSFMQRTGITVRTELAFEGRLPGTTETHLFRIAQEALTNIARHSKATAVDLILREEKGALVLTVRDNGHGMAAGVRPDGFGLIGMRERAGAIGGSLEITTGSKGVTIRAGTSRELFQQAIAHPSPARG